MKTLYLKYYKPKAYIALSALFIFDAGGGYWVFSASDPVERIIALSVFSLLLIYSYFGITDALIPTLQNKPVCIIDENGFTDIISWGLVRWSNIESIVPFKATSLGKGYYSFTQMHILINDVVDYEAYQNSRWIRFKLAFYRRGKGARITVDIDALEGKATEVVKSINAYFEYYMSNKN